MQSLKLQVVCEDNKIEFFSEGIVGAYYHVGNPIKDDLNPEYIIKVFFDNTGEFKGIFLSDDYKEELQDELESLIHCSVPRELEEYEHLSSIKIKDNDICLEDLYICKKCKKVHVWDDSKIWSCEECDEYICSNCIEEYNEDARYTGISNLEIILCDTCFDK